MPNAGFTKRAVLLAALALPACGALDDAAGDTDAGASAGGTGGQLGDGVRLDCGYHLQNLPAPADAAVGYPHPNTMCVDPSDPSLDTNGDGSLNLQEMVGACDLKCPNGAPTDGGYPFDGPAFSASWDGAVPFSLQPPYEGCQAVQARIDTAAGPCNPSHPSHTETWPTTLVPPSHEGAFTSEPSGNHADVTVNGRSQSVDFLGQVAFSVYDCEARGRQQACLLDLQRLSLTLGSTPVFGDYEVSFAQLELNRTATTPVSFACDMTGCSGSFDFLSRAGTTVAADFNVEQKNLATGAAGGGLVTLGADALGGFTRISGELDLNLEKSAGTMRLWGSGEDSLGGDLASALFDLTSTVGKPSL